MDIYFPYQKSEEKESITATIAGIYSHIEDDISRLIFVNRLLYSLTNDFQFIRNVVVTNNVGAQFEEGLKKHESIYIYGAGMRGERISKIYSDVAWSGYIDAFKTGVCNGKRIVPLENFKADTDTVVLISNLRDASEIRHVLTQKGVHPDNIVLSTYWNDMAAKNQYFDKRCLESVRFMKGAFVDLGAFDGRDTLRFVEYTKDRECEAYIFEPEKENYERCKENLAGIKGVSVYKNAVTNRESVVYISKDGAISGVVGANSIKRTEVVKTVNLDKVLRGKTIGMIKMDIEGSEEEAICGAERIIRKQHPVLAISIYHAREDIWKLPEMILNMYDGYMFSLGHYSVTDNDTVIYALPKEWS